MTERRLPKTAVENLVVDLASKANVALTNSPYTTNRILEIPQNIKLDLNNGTLTLKAGSKVYVPNGPGVFDAVTTASDLSTMSQDSQDCIAWYNTDTGTIQLFPSILFYSGTTAPSDYQFMFWYDTTNNKCKVTSDSGSTWVEGKSFPICVVSTDGTKISAIKQVFNGFGYIGSTLFALPGVKIQIPNGRNEDGTLKSIEHTNSSVITTQEAGNKNSVNLVLTINAIGGNIVYDYDEKANYCFRNDTGAIYTDRVIIGKISVSSDKITSIEPFTVDSVVNSNVFYQLKDKAVTTDTAQTISGVKTFTGGTLQAIRPVLLKENNANEGGQIHFERSNNSVLKYDPYIDLLINTIRFIGVNSQNATHIPLQVDLENGVVMVPTPGANANDTQPATTAWFRQSNCAVRTVVSTYVNGANWYRVWNDGWIEQSGVVRAGGTAMLTGNLLKPFSNTNYSLLVTGRAQSAANYTVIATPKTNSTFSYYWGTAVLDVQWYACGY